VGGGEDLHVRSEGVDLLLKSPGLALAQEHDIEERRSRLNSMRLVIIWCSSTLAS